MKGTSAVIAQPAESDAHLGQHFLDDRAQGGQMNRRDLPHIARLDPIIFVPQQVSDPDHWLPVHVWLFVAQLQAEFLGGLRNDLDRPFDRALVKEAVVHLLEGKPLRGGDDAVDLRQDMLKPGLRQLGGNHQKTRIPPPSI